MSNHVSGYANPLRTVWKDCFVDALLLKNKNMILRRSTILSEFVGCTFRIYNGKTFIKCKIIEEKVGHKFGEFAMTRKRRSLGSAKRQCTKKEEG
ncbi:40S ribosomal protein S19 [Morus notabilis]|uniref:40S ribosomal protein S19 n=1 Tax=Morus notabilis TaxID=981085 RepID=W9QXL0_9ROSA|nr:40S ribosomal protein S19 [Morus notabilis]